MPTCMDMFPLFCVPTDLDSSSMVLLIVTHLPLTHLCSGRRLVHVMYTPPCHMQDDGGKACPICAHCSACPLTLAAQWV